jgi:lambda family phage tail tape measure protein
MAAENTGTAKISLELDLANYSLSVDKAKQQATGLGAAAEEAFNQSNSKAKQAAVSLARYITLVGKSADEAKVLRAQWAGISTTVLDDLAEKLAAVRQEEEITNTNTRIMADSFAAMQVKARAAFSELQSAARADQLRIDEAAARDVNRQLAEMAANTKLAEERTRQLAAAQQTNAIAAQSWYEKNLAALTAERAASANALATTQAANKASADAAYQHRTAALLAERAQQASNAAVKTGGIEFNKYGLSAKQTAAALRQVPAQITDIFVSLQGGQRPLTVLLQQGGQLKDVFGGVVPAVKALSSALLGLLLNPVVLVTAAVAGLAYAWKSGTDEQDAYNQSLILTGNYAAQTIGTMNSLAGRIGNTVSTQHAAATTLAEVAASGKIAAGSIELVTRAAEQMRVTTGKAVKETVAEFVSLADDPTKAIVKLNETQHFLTSGIYEQIKALQEQGNKQAAAALAEKTYADAIADRTKEIKANLGTVETAWNALARGAKLAWDSMLDVGRPSVGDEKLLGLQAAANAAAIAYENLKNKKPTSTWYSLNLQDKAYYAQWLADAKKRSDDATKAYHDEEHKQQAERDNATAGVARQQANEAAIALGQEAAKYEPAEKKRAADIAAAHKQANDAIAKLNSVSDAALIKIIRDNEAKVVAGLNAKGASSAHSLANAQADAQVQAIKDALTKEQALIQNDGKLLQAQYSARLVSAKDYYAQQSVLIDRDTKAQEKALTDQIAYLKTRDVAGKDSVKTSKDIGEAEAKLAKVRADGATAQKTLAIEEANATKQRELALRSYRDAFDSANASAKASADAAVARITLGEREAAQQEKVAAILAKSAEDQKALAREFADNKDTELYQEKLQALREYTDEQVRIATDGYARLQAAQADWLNGVKGGIANWMEQTKDVASQTTAITGRTLDAGANAFDQFAETGKADIKGMLRGIASDIAKFMARQAVLKFIQLFLPGGGAASTSTSAYNGVGGVNSGFNAKGNVFTNSPSLSAYSGTVLTKPTFFTAYAKGGNVAGEAGPEGIFPLERDSRGRLGITAQGVGGGDVYMTMSFIINSDGTNSSTSSANDDAKMYKSFMGEVGNLVESKINRAMMPGGQLWKAGVSANG